jgi:hypothetical protein
MLSLNFIEGCSVINPTHQEINNPTQGSAQSGDPAIFEHRN